MKHNPTIHDKASKIMEAIHLAHQKEYNQTKAGEIYAEPFTPKQLKIITTALASLGGEEEKSFEDWLQSELDKLPYEKHADDGMYNDGRLYGFELGARAAMKQFAHPSEREVLEGFINWRNNQAELKGLKEYISTFALDRYLAEKGETK